MALTTHAASSRTSNGLPSASRRIRARVVASATPRATAVTVALYLASVALLTLSDRQITRHAPQVTKPDLTFGYSHAQIVETFTALGEAGRRACAINLLIDTVMPVLLAAATVVVIAGRLPAGWGC
jgi:hypothetical protein